MFFFLLKHLLVHKWLNALSIVTILNFFCSAKAIVEGWMEKIFNKTTCIDLNQDKVFSELLAWLTTKLQAANSKEDPNERRWPSDLKNCFFQIKEMNSEKFWNIKLKIVDKVSRIEFEKQCVQQTT